MSFKGRGGCGGSKQSTNPLLSRLIALESVGAEKCPKCSKPMVLAEHTGYLRCFNKLCQSRTKFFVSEGDMSAVPFTVEQTLFGTFGQKQGDFVAKRTIDPASGKVKISVDRGYTDAKLAFANDAANMHSIMSSEQQMSDSSNATACLTGLFAGNQTSHFTTSGGGFVSAGTSSISSNNSISSSSAGIVSKKSTGVMQMNDSNFALVEAVFSYIHKGGRKTKESQSTNKREMVMSDQTVIDSVNWSPSDSMMCYIARQLCFNVCSRQMSCDAFRKSHPLYSTHLAKAVACGHQEEAVEVSVSGILPSIDLHKNTESASFENALHLEHSSSSESIPWSSTPSSESCSNVYSDTECSSRTTDEVVLLESSTSTNDGCIVTSPSSASLGCEDEYVVAMENNTCAITMVKSSDETLCSDHCDEEQYSACNHSNCHWKLYPINISELKLIISKFASSGDNDWKRISQNHWFLVRIMSRLYEFSIPKLTSSQLQDISARYQEARALESLISRQETKLIDSGHIGSKRSKKKAQNKIVGAMIISSEQESSSTQPMQPSNANDCNTNLIPSLSCSANDNITEDQKPSKHNESLDDGVVDRSSPKLLKKEKQLLAKCPPGYVWFRIVHDVYCRSVIDSQGNDVALDEIDEVRLLPHFFPLINDASKLMILDEWWSDVCRIKRWHEFLPSTQYHHSRHVEELAEMEQSLCDEERILPSMNTNIHGESVFCLLDLMAVYCEKPKQVLHCAGMSRRAVQNEEKRLLQEHAHRQDLVQKTRSSYAVRLRTKTDIVIV